MATQEPRANMAAQELYLPRRPGTALGRGALRFFRTKPLGAIGGTLLALTVLLAVLGSWIAPYEPNKIYAKERLKPPSTAHWFGTDDFGRDVLSRLLVGARVSLYVSLSAVVVGTGLGALLGLLSGYWGGRFDLISQRLIDIKQGFPSLILALALVAALGASITNVIIAIAVTRVGGATRLVRASTLSLKEITFVEAARSIGASQWRIMFRHVLPGCMAPFLIIATSAIGSAILTEASLGFLGLGVPPPNATWGAMLSSAQQYFRGAPWVAIAPGVVITVIVLSVNLFGDALRDVWDPKLRGKTR